MFRPAGRDRPEWPRVKPPISTTIFAANGNTGSRNTSENQLSPMLTVENEF